MMKALKISLLFAVALLALASCTTFKASGLSMTLDSQKYTVVGSFSTTVWVNEFLGYAAGAKLVNLSADATDSAVKDAIQKEIRAKGGIAAVDVTITHQASFVNLLLNGITLSLYAPSTLIITGTIVK
jgi:Na+-translocating ferredoxin:NAD+ oxidoreductase RnfE subunit